MLRTAYPSVAGSPGPFERNTPSGSTREHFARGRGSRNDFEGRELTELPEHRRLDAEVVRHDAERT